MTKGAPTCSLNPVRFRLLVVPDLVGCSQNCWRKCEGRDPSVGAGVRPVLATQPFERRVQNVSPAISPWSQRITVAVGGMNETGLLRLLLDLLPQARDGVVHRSGIRRIVRISPHRAQ